MYLIGLTLEVKGGSRSAEAPSLAILEIQFASPGLKTWLTDFLSDGLPVISDIGWIEDKLFLSFLPNNVVDYESLKNNWLAAHAEHYVQQVATALGWEL